MKYYTEKDNSYIRENYSKLNAKEIAHNLNRSHQSIIIKANKMRLIGKRNINNNDKDFINKNYKIMTSREIAKNLNRPYGSIKCFLQRNKMKKRREREGIKKLLNDDILTYYFMGYWFADGTLLKSKNIAKGISITTHEKDNEHLNFLINKLNIKDYFFQKIKSQHSVRYTFWDTNNIQELIKKFHIYDRKTYNPPDSLNFIKDNNLFLAFFIGYIDGDGCILKTKKNYFKLNTECNNSWINIYKEFKIKIYSIFNIKQTKNLVSLNNIKNTITMSLSKENILYNLYKFIKNNNLPVMERKWNKLQELENKILLRGN
jgi:hypothetical protein